MIKQIFFGSLFFCFLCTHAYSVHEWDATGADIVTRAKRGEFIPSEEVSMLIDLAKSGQVVSYYSSVQPLNDEDFEEHKNVVIEIIGDKSKAKRFFDSLEKSGLDRCSQLALLVLIPEYDL